MPLYEFICEECLKEFDLIISHKERDKAKCPECGSSKVKQKLSSFYSPGSGGSSCSASSCSSGCTG